MTSLRVLLVLVFLFPAASLQGAEARRLEVLFLGDDGHHKPLERYRALKANLGTRGYNLSFIEDLSEITKDRLDLYDVVIVYANHEQNEVPADLLGWVRDGGGLVALHSACGCFRKSPEWFEVIGGRFQSHEGHVFSPETIDKEHAITKELPGFEAWDETYEHQDLAEDRHVLQQRPALNKDETEPEPWTWVRREGKGRVFYTASGHDMRVWGQPAYQELVARAIVWTADPEAARAFAALKLAPLEVEVPAVANRAHPDLPMMPLQKPLTAEESALHTQVPAGTRLVLFASEPMVVNPIAIDWDERGRAWVVESFGYPNDVPKEPGTGQDRIKILEDTDGDGRADKMTVFADKLRHCTTTAFVRGGVVATDGPDIVFLRDDDGDGKADLRRVVASGIRMADTHASASHFLYGMDNWIYGTVGYSGLDMDLHGKKYKVGKCVYRFRPDLSDFEILQETTNNTWGLGFTSDGDIVGSTANNNPSWQVSIPSSAYEGSGLKQPRTPRLDDQPFMFTNTRDITQVDQIEKYTAAAGHMMYNDTVLSGVVPEDTALICEPTGHVAAMGPLVEAGSLHKTVLRGNNIFASADAWAAPVAARPGPDGAIWVADWYNPIIQHNVVFRYWNPARGYDQPHSPYHVGGRGPGKGNAYVTPLRDREHGRIWRIVPASKKSRKVSALSADDSTALVRTLKSPSQHLRLQAQRLLVERGEGDVIPSLKEMVSAGATPEGMSEPLGAFHALRTLQGLADARVEGARAPILGALDAPHEGVRLQAMQSLPHDNPVLVAKLPNLLEGLVSDRAKRLTFTACALAPPNEGISEALWEVLKTQDLPDPVVREAARLAVRRQGTTLLAMAVSGDSLPDGWLGKEVDELARRIAAGPNRPALVSIVANASEKLRVRFEAILEEAPAEFVEPEQLPEHLVFGRDAYMKACVECHQADGMGVENTFPPLAGSAWVSGDSKRMLRIVLGGLMGRITVKGVEYNSVMPGHSHASDEELAAIASFVRYQFGGLRENPVAPAEVAELRPEVTKRKFMPWTVEELPKE